MIASNYPGLTPEASEMLKHQYGFRTDAQSAVSLESVSAHDILDSKHLPQPMHGLNY